MSDDRSYYENPNLWKAEVYTSAFEVARLRAAVALVPADARTLLDVGCGNGTFLRELELERPDVLLNGTDRSKAAISARLCKSIVELADITRLPFPDRKYDLVSCLAVVEHLPLASYSVALGELQRVAAKYVLLNVPFNEKRVRARCPSCGCAFDPHYHMRRYTRDDFPALMKSFKLEKFEILSGPEPFVSWAIRRARLDLSARRYQNSVCPQCGFSAVEENSPSGSKEGSTLKRLLKKVVKSVPDIIEQREIFALYKRV